MRKIKEFKMFLESNSFFLDEAVVIIKEQFPEEEVVSIYDQEILEWVDDDWEDDYESEYEWYIDHNNGEAQDVVIEGIIKWYMTNVDSDLNIDNQIELSDKLKEEYSI